jgi:hypothetical protein
MSQPPDPGQRPVVEQPPGHGVGPSFPGQPYFQGSKIFSTVRFFKIVPKIFNSEIF